MGIHLPSSSFTPYPPFRHAILHWLGDNNAALTWASERKRGSRNPACQRVFMAITILEQTTAISLSRTSQIKSEDMGDVDLVSRGHLLNLETLTPDRMVDTTTWVVFRDLMVDCKPASRIRPRATPPRVSLRVRHSDQHTGHTSQTGYTVKGIVAPGSGEERR